MSLQALGGTDSNKWRWEGSHIRSVICISCGQLMYAMVCTRSDIAQAVRVVSRYMSNPEKKHWRALKWIMRYLKGSSDITLCYGGTDVQLLRYIDSNFVGDIDSQRSTIGYVFTLGSGVVSWLSRMQKIVAMLMMEAKYVAATEVCKGWYGWRIF